MKKVVLMMVTLLLLIMVGCGIQSDLPAIEESSAIKEDTQTTDFEWPTSSYEQLESEVKRLEQLLSDHNITYWRDPHPIDLAYQEAMKEAVESSFSGYRGVISEYAAIWKEEMEKYLGLLDEVLDEEHKKMLVVSQKIWDSSIDDSFKLEYEIIGRASGFGSIMGDIARANQLNKYRDRTLFLEMLYRNAQDETYQSWPWPYLDESDY